MINLIVLLVVIGAFMFLVCLGARTVEMMLDDPEWIDEDEGE